MHRFKIAGLVAVLLLGLLPMPVVAVVESCSASVSPSQVVPGSDSVVQVRVTNISGPTVVWFSVTRPNSDYVVTSAAAEGWSAQVTASNSTVTGGALDGDGRVTLDLGIHAVAWQSPLANWVVKVSDNPDGSGATICNGPRATSIGVDMPGENEGQGVSGVSAVPAANSVKVAWTSDVATGSAVRYGQTNDYGFSSSYNAALTIHHEVVINGLVSATGYHFQVVGVDGDGSAVFSGDNTFVTNVIVEGSIPAPAAPAGETPVPAETVAPTVVVSTQLTGTYMTSPTITGVAADNATVARVEYSTDGGKNWLAAALGTVVSVGRGRNKTMKVDFSFRPVLVDDGNYLVVVRAVDGSGNTAVVTLGTLVLDRLPPRLGGLLLTVGSQALTPDVAGRWPAAVDVDETITLNAVGGPTVVVIEAKKAGADRPGQSFYLRQDDQSGLWRGLASFHQPGAYSLTARAVDGAGNRTESVLPEMTVAPAASVVTAGGDGVGGAEVTVYYRADDRWTVWDGSAFGQRNPQTTRGNGSFRILAPAGTYYLKVTAPHYRTLVTGQFKLDGPAPLVPTLRLQEAAVWHIGPWSVALPWLNLVRAEIKPLGEVSGRPAKGLVGLSMPAFDFATTDGGVVLAAGMLGKPTVVTVLSSWVPLTNDQLPVLASLQADHRVNVVPMVSGERLSRVKAFLNRGHYGLMVAVDEQAILGQALGIPVPPTHYLIDRKGIIRAVLTGVRTGEELTSALGAL